MARWQTYGVHPITAFLLAGSTFTALTRFPILDFSGAPLAAAAVIGVSFLLLSRKYDPSLSAIFLGLALVTAYKITNHKPQHMIQERPEYTAAKTLAVAVAEVHNASDVSDPKTVLMNLPLSQPVFLCAPSLCVDEAPAKFKIRFAHDNAGKIWYMNDRFELFQRDADGQSHPQTY